MSAEVIVLREVLYAIESGAELIQLLDRVTAGNMSVRPTIFSIIYLC